MHNSTVPYSTKDFKSISYLIFKPVEKKTVILIAMLLFGPGLTGANAQQAMPASGGDASGSGGFVSYSVGQVVYTTHTGANGSVAQGVQQTYEIAVESGIE